MRKTTATVLIALLTALGTIVAIGSPAAADDHVRIHLIHGIPDTDVDVEANGSNAFENFSFSDTQDLSSLAGATLENLRVKVAGTDTVAIDAGDITLPSEGNFTIMAHLDADGAPTISVFENDESTIAAGQGRLVVRHTAAAPEVDILANGAVAFAAVPNGVGGGADLPAGVIEASVVPAGASEPVVIGPADLPITEGSSLIVYAVGSLADDTLTVLTESIDGLGSAPARVDTGNSPVDGASTTPWILAVVAIAIVGGSVTAIRRPAAVKA